MQALVCGLSEGESSKGSPVAQQLWGRNRRSRPWAKSSQEMVAASSEGFDGGFLLCVLGLRQGCR